MLKPLSLVGMRAGVGRIGMANLVWDLDWTLRSTSSVPLFLSMPLMGPSTLEPHVHRQSDPLVPDDFHRTMVHLPPVCQTCEQR